MFLLQANKMKKGTQSFHSPELVGRMGTPPVWSHFRESDAMVVVSVPTILLFFLLNVLFIQGNIRSERCREVSFVGFQKRQLIPFPRVGKRLPMVPMTMPVYMDPYLAEYEAAQYAPWYDTSDSLMSTPDFPSSSNKDDNNLEVDKKNSAAPNANGGMWFGPRLGRKKRSIDSSEASSEHSTLDTRTLVKILHNFNWAIVPIKGLCQY